MSFSGITWAKITAGAVGFVAIAVVLSNFGFEFPKIATHATIAVHAQKNDLAFSELESEVMRVAQLATQSSLESAERRSGELRILILQMEAARASCAQKPDCDESLLDPAPLRAQVRNLERQTESLKSDLKGMTK